MKGNLFLKLEEKTSNKKTPKFLNVTYWIHFAFVQEKMGEMVSVL